MAFLSLKRFFHEMGHALEYRISTGKAKWKVIAGSGPRMLRKGLESDALQVVHVLKDRKAP